MARWTKRQLVDEAFNELAMAGFVFDMTPEEREAALRRLESMMASWAGQGLYTNYVYDIDPSNADLDDDSQAAPWAVEAIYMHLAIRLAAQFGKTLPLGTIAVAKNAYDSMTVRALEMPSIPVPSNMPMGAGNRLWGRVYFPVTPEESGDPQELT